MPLERKFEGKFKKKMDAKRYGALTAEKEYKFQGASYKIVPGHIAEYIRSIAPKGYKTPEEAVFRLARHFGTEFGWSERKSPSTIASMLESQEGNCHTKAALLTAALRQMGVPADMKFLRGQYGHALVEVHLPDGLVGIDFQPSSFQVTTKEHIWQVYDNVVTAMDIREAHPSFPESQRIETFTFFNEEGKGISQIGMADERVSTRLEKIILKHALE